MFNLNIYYQNVRGLRTKTSTFSRNVCLCDYDVIGITESWSLDSISSSELFDDRYIVWRRDRNYLRTQQTKGGGVLMAVKRSHTAFERPEWSSSAEDTYMGYRHTRQEKAFGFSQNSYVCRLSNWRRVR